MNLEGDHYVWVQSGGSSSHHDKGILEIRILPGYGGGSHSINGYTGGLYTVPDSTGPVTLTSVMGSLTSSTMIVHFKYAGGTGSFTPETGSFSMAQ